MGSETRSSSEQMFKRRTQRIETRYWYNALSFLSYKRLTSRASREWEALSSNWADFVPARRYNKPIHVRCSTNGVQHLYSGRRREFRPPTEKEQKREKERRKSEQDKRDERKREVSSYLCSLFLFSFFFFCCFLTLALLSILFIRNSENLADDWLLLTMF